MAIADKLQKLVNGKQYVIDKTNAKAETSLPINCTWKELGDTIENISGGINTTDATATANDIRIGKTAYVGTGKISGTIEDYDGAYEGEAATPSGGVVEVEQLPTSNVQEDTIYKTNEVSDINVYVVVNNQLDWYTLEEMVADLGVTPNITYYLVDSLPTNPNVSDMATFSETHVYIYEDMGYVYCNVGYGDMWIDLATLLSSMSGGITFENKGYISSPYKCTEQGIYVSYKLGTYGINFKKYFIKEYDTEWNNYSKLYDDLLFKRMTSYSNNQIDKIDDCMFAFQWSLVSVDIPNCTSIGNKAFYDAGLENIDLTNVTKIGQYAFYKCPLKNIYAPNIVEMTYASDCFLDCVFLESVDLPKVIELGYESFQNCTSLKNVNLPSFKTTNGGRDFKGCTSLENISLPSLEIVSYEFFWNCTNLKKVNLPKVKKIYSGAFAYCESLESIYLPNVNDIGDRIASQFSTFYECSELKAIIIGQNESVCVLHYNDLPIHFINERGDSNGYIYVPDNLVNDYKVAGNWSFYASRIKPLSELPQEYKTLYGI